MIDLIHILGTRLPRSVARFYPDVLWRMPATEPIAYFTFDDGPTSSVTGVLLDILARFDVPATFFVVGQHAKRDPGLVRAIVEAGHVVGNHSYSHPDPWKTTTDLLLGELERTTTLLEDLTQEPIRWMRPPYGHFTSPMRRWCQVRRQRLTMWDTGPGDFLPSATQEIIEQRMLNAIRPGFIATALAAGRPDADADQIQQLRQEGANNQVLGRVGEPSDIANMALFLASDESEWMTGQEWVVDGGFEAGRPWSQWPEFAKMERPIRHHRPPVR